MTNSLKNKTSLAIFWSFIDKGGQQILQLVFRVILARILLTSDIGTFALLAIFTAIANVLQESGFSSALIRKKNPEEADYASVFYFNIGISIIIYAILFLSAPLISKFYNNPMLTPLAQITFLSFVFNAFGIVQNVILARKMDFKTNTKITLFAGSISGVIAITLALQGYGIWSLVIQLVLQSLLRSLLLWLFVKWKPQTSFSGNHIKNMAAYSSKLLLTSVMNQFCSNLYANIIGKFFSTHQVGIYTEANKFSILPQSVISDGLRSATFPALSKIDDDSSYRKKAYRKTVRLTAFISFPIAILIIVTAKPIILLLLTDKWANAIPILQILAIGGAFYPLYNSVSTLLQVIGKSGLILKLEIFRNLLALSILLFTIQQGVHEIAFGISLSSIIAFLVGTIIAGKKIKYKFLEIAKDIVPYAVISFICFAPFYFIESFISSNLWVQLFIPTIIGASIYLGILKASGSVILQDSIVFFKDLIK